jgi:hypothetical protein
MSRELCLSEILLSRICIDKEIEDVGAREYCPQSLSNTSFRLELIFKIALFSRPLPVRTPPLARIGASVVDLDKLTEKLP